jgi:calcineurin-like phosphoesterase family protein
MNYYISDIHIGCINKFDNKTLDDDIKLINNWNKRICNNDNVYILGDIARLGNNKDNSYACSIISQLKGIRHLIVGNHDVKGLKDNRVSQLFESIDYIKTITDNYNGMNYNLVLCHYPILFWENQHKGWVHLYGHVHSSCEWNEYKKCLREVNNYFTDRELKGYTDCPQAKAYNVGAMLQDYTPYTLKEIMETNYDR